MCQYLVRGLEGITSVFSLVIVDVIAASVSRMGKLRLEVMWKASPRGSLGSILLSPTWNHLICSFHSLLALSKGEPQNHLPNGRVQGGEKGRSVFCSVPSLPFHNTNPFPLAHLLFKFLGPSSRQGRVCVLELSTPFHRWRNRLGGRWAHPASPGQKEGY